jgi:hypothetical protein
MNGVIYYNRGQKCIIRIATSLHSLRNYYDGNVTIIQHDKPNKQVDKILSWLSERYNVDIQHLETDAPAQNITNSLQFKAHLWEYTPYQNTIFLDADTIVRGDISGLHTLADKHGMAFTDFCGWSTRGNKISRRIKSWLPVIGASEVENALDHDSVVNTGVFAFTVTRKTRPFLEEWRDITDEGFEKNCTKRILDEVACQVLLHKYPDDHTMAPSEYNASVRFGPANNPIVIHYHGSKHVGEWDVCEHWKDAYWEMRNGSDVYDLLGNHFGDRRFRQYLKDVVKSDMTIVSAVNPKYIDRVCSNVDKWMKMKGIREQKILFFVHGWTRLRANETRPIRKYKNISVVKWEFPIASTEREKMLSSFVFGVAKHVKTRYWMKLDGDCTPKVDEFEWPDYRKNTITAHRWGYTKMKHDPDLSDHWLNRLDKWWGGKPLFDEQYHPVEHAKVRHRRFCSFCSIEKTKFTQQLAKRCGDRLPIPSQDTTTWYVAERERRSSWHGENMKRYFSP